MTKRRRPRTKSVPGSMVLRGVGDPRVRRDVAAWLRKAAVHLVKHGDEYAPRFTASLRYY